MDRRTDLAVNCVDICDAWAHCAWAGKRLCTAGGAAPNQFTLFGDEELDEVATSEKSEWFNVCSQAGTTSYPYGDTYVPGVCVDGAKTQSGGEDARSVENTALSECHGTSPPYDQVFNMSGDGWQWQNICGRVRHTGRPVVRNRRDEAVVGERGRADANEQTLPPSLLVQRVIDALRVGDHVRAWGDTAQRTANLDTLVAMAQEYEQSARSVGTAATLTGLIAHLDQLEADEADETRPPYGVDAVTILTYHRAPPVRSWVLDPLPVRWSSRVGGVSPGLIPVGQSTDGRRGGHRRRRGGGWVPHSSKSVRFAP